jgi:hypothetical protein
VSDWDWDMTVLVPGLKACSKSKFGSAAEINIKQFNHLWLFHKFNNK